MEVGREEKEMDETRDILKVSGFPCFKLKTKLSAMLCVWFQNWKRCDVLVGE